MSSNADLLGEIAEQANLERTSFMVDAARQLEDFLKRNASRIRELGGLVLIDDDPDYLSLAPDGTFRSRTRYQDRATGEWVSETEVVESASELVELYNPAEVYAAFAEAARDAAGLPDRPTAAGEVDGAAGVSLSDRSGPYADAGDSWAATRAGGRGAGRQGISGALHLRPRPDLPGTEPAVRGGPARAVPGRGRAAHPLDRRHGHRRR